MSRDDKRRRKRRQRTEENPKSVWIMMSAAVVLGVVIIAMVAQLVRLNRQGERLNTQTKTEASVDNSAENRRIKESKGNGSTAGDAGTGSRAYP